MAKINSTTSKVKPGEEFEGRKMDRSQLDLMFNPTSVAVFGASETSSGVGARVFANLLAGGFDGPVVPINPKYETVAGRPCFANLAAAKANFDLAVIATPARTVPGLIAQCAKAETRNAIVLSAGFGEGAASERRLADALENAARRGDVRVLGPNCVGVVRPWLGLDATFLSSTTPKGRLALISQSGALCSAISDWAGPLGGGWRRDAIQSLKTLRYRSSLEDPKLIGDELSELLRRIAIAHRGRHACAGLTGEAWLEWLSRDDPTGFDWKKPPVPTTAADGYLPAGRTAPVPSPRNAGNVQSAGTTARAAR